MLFLVVFFASAISVAHEQKAAFTDVFYNERTGNLEIAHRFSLHDAEHTLHKAPEMTADLTKSEEAQAAFADYVAARFKLRFADKTVIPLTLVGQERERGYFWVYQEAKIPKPIGKAFLIENRPRSPMSFTMSELGIWKSLTASVFTMRSIPCIKRLK